MSAPANTATFHLPTDPAKWPPFMLRVEAAKVGRCCVGTVIRAERLGLLKPVRRGGVGSTRTLYRREDVVRWLTGGAA